MTTSRSDIASWILAGLSLVAVLKLGLLPALLAALLVYELVHVMASRFGFLRVDRRVVVVATARVDHVIGRATEADAGVEIDHVERQGRVHRD